MPATYARDTGGNTFPENSYVKAIRTRVTALEASSHAESHTVASHNDTTATGAELETLTDGSNADVLHDHDHGAISGLADDDHTQYLLADGTRVVENYLDIAETLAAGTPAIDNIRIYAVEDDDFTVLETVTNLGVVNRINQDTFRIARNTTGGSLAKGTAVRYSGSTGNKPNIAAVQANAIGTMPAIGVLGTAVADNAYGEVMIIGRITGIKTDYTNAGEPTYAPVADWAEGDVLYVNSAVLGGLQNSKPTHPNFSQWIATIESVHATQGIILVKTQAMLGLEDGTNQNTFTIGDGAAGTQTLAFDGAADSSISWDGTNIDIGGVTDTSELATLTDGSDADALHSHAILDSRMFGTLNCGKVASFSASAWAAYDNAMNMSAAQGFTALKDGSIRGISWSAVCHAHTTTGVLRIQVYANGWAYNTAGTSITGVAVFSEAEPQAAGTYTFSQGDILSAYIQFVAPSAYSIREMIISIYVQYD
jgi:hypothetical protein